MRETDVALFEKASAHDEHALELLYDRYEKLVFSFAYRMTKNTSIAEEVVQDVFTKIWSKQRNYHAEKGKFSSWILTMTRNATIDRLRKEKEPTLEWEERDSLQDNAVSTEDQIEWKEKKEHIHKAIHQLPSEQQKIIELFYFKGMPQSLIAKECDIPIGTVKGRVRLALKHLHDMFSPIQKKGDQKDV